MRRLIYQGPKNRGDMNDYCRNCNSRRNCLLEGECIKSGEPLCVPDPMQRSCLDAQPESEPVTDEPPHLADRRLAEIRRNLSGQMQFATELRDEARKGDPVWHRNEGVRVGLFNAICAIDNATAPAAEAREERPSGRPNDQGHRSGGDNT